MPHHTPNKRRYDPAAFLRGLWDDFESYDYLSPATSAPTFFSMSEPEAEDLSTPDAITTPLLSPQPTVRRQYTPIPQAARPRAMGVGPRGGRRGMTAAAGGRRASAPPPPPRNEPPASARHAHSSENKDDTDEPDVEELSAEEHDPNVVHEGRGGARYRWKKTATGRWKKVYLTRTGLTPRGAAAPAAASAAASAAAM